MYSMMTVTKSTILYIWKLLKIVGLNSSLHKEKNFCSYVRWWILAKLIVIIIFNIYKYHIIVLYTLHNFLCQLYNNKTGIKEFGIPKYILN